MGGDLSLYSQGHGFGSTFTLKLPTHAQLSESSALGFESDSINRFAL